MSVIFKRITKMEWVKEHTFHMGGAIYLALTSGDDVPMSSSGSLPEVISVDIARMALLLVEAGALKKESIPEWLRPQYEDEVSYLPDCNYYCDAISEMRDNKESTKMMLRDYRSAVRKGDMQINYRVS